MRALIVDDDPSVRQLLATRLTRDHGATVVEATSGLEALQQLARQSFDLLLLELVLPGMDGMDVLRAIRATPAIAALPVAVTSTVRDEARVREAIELGVGAYLIKPLSHDDLGIRLQRFVERAGLVQATPRPSLVLPPGGRIVVLDGDREFLELVAMTLQPRFTVFPALNGPDGFLKCLERQPGLVLLGENLGVLPAAVFVETLRSLPQFARVPIVGIVTPGGPPMTTKVNGTITRTLQPDALRQQFEHLVGRESRAGL